MKGQLTDVEEKYAIAKGEYEQAVQQYDNIKNEYDSIQLRIEELDQEIEIARTSISDANVTRGKLEGEIAVLKNRLKMRREMNSIFMTVPIPSKSRFRRRNRRNPGFLLTKLYMMKKWLLWNSPEMRQRIL